MDDQTWTNDEVHEHLGALLSRQHMAVLWALMKSGMDPKSAAQILRQARDRFVRSMADYNREIEAAHERGECSCSFDAAAAPASGTNVWIREVRWSR